MGSFFNKRGNSAGVMDEVQELWDKALLAANENYNAE